MNKQDTRRVVGSSSDILEEKRKNQNGSRAEEGRVKAVLSNIFEDMTKNGHKIDLLIEFLNEEYFDRLRKIDALLFYPATVR